jgi:hypothetical protein
MKAHQGGGDVVRIERGATFHSTVHGHSTYPNPGPGQVLGNVRAHMRKPALPRTDSTDPRTDEARAPPP